jgi:beta-1,4-mannosyl-glycoprotein beta-1,4-N-acetylglucosaminyltransferase
MDQTKVYDCFRFNGEFRVLEIRLNELWDVVDKFIIMESSYTHTGGLKKFTLDDTWSDYDKYKEKIIIVRSKKNRKRWTSVHREYVQRAELDRGIKRVKANPQDLIIISDVDEIPRHSIIEELKKSPINCQLEVDVYIRHINLYFHKWNHIRIIPYSEFKGNKKALRDIWISKTFNYRRFPFIPILRINDYFSVNWWDRKIGFISLFKEYPLPVITNAGWHFTQLMTFDEIVKKMSTNSHPEIAQTSIETIKKQIKNREAAHVSARSLRGTIIPIDDSFPSFVLKNLDKFEEFILKQQ